MTRSRVCIDCRSVLAEGESCAPKHRVTSLDTPKGRDVLLNEVWGPPSFRRQARRLAKAGGGGAAAGSALDGCGSVSGCDLAGIDGEIGAAIVVIVVAALAAVAVGWVIWKIIQAIREHQARPKPHGALSPPPPPRGRTLRGTVHAPGDRHDSPVSTTANVGYSLEYRASRVIGRATTLVDAATEGFEVRCDDGQRVRVPAGTIRLVAKPRKLDDDERERADKHLSTIDALRTKNVEADNPMTDPIPFDAVYAAHLCDGDRVEISGELEARPDPDAAGGGYRSAAMLLVPIGVPTVHVGSD